MTASFPGFEPGFEARLERLALRFRQPAAGRWSGLERSRYVGRGLAFADHRPYAEGDEPRLVDWRAYARHGRLYTRRFEEERDRHVTLVVDASASMDHGDGLRHKGLYARRLAAALAYVAVLRHLTVDALCLRGGGLQVGPTVRGPGGLPALFRFLAATREAGTAGLAQALRHVRGRQTVILISDLLEPGWESGLMLLGGSRRAGAVIQVLAPDEWEPPLGGEVELVDAETGAVLEAHLTPAGLEAYQVALQTFLSNVRARCGRQGLRHAALNTGTPVEQAVLRALPAVGLLEW